MGTDARQNQREPRPRESIPVRLTTIPPATQPGWQPPNWLEKAVQVSAKVLAQLGCALVLAGLLRQETTCLTWVVVGLAPSAYSFVRFLMLRGWISKCDSLMKSVRASPDLCRFFELNEPRGWITDAGLLYLEGSGYAWREFSAYHLERTSGRAHRLSLWINPKNRLRDFADDAVVCGLNLAAAIVLWSAGLHCLRIGSLTNDVLSLLCLAGTNLFVAVHVGLHAPSNLVRLHEQSPPFSGVIDVEDASECEIVQAIGDRIRRWQPPSTPDHRRSG